METTITTTKPRSRSRATVTREPESFAATRRATRIAALSREPDNANSIRFAATRELADSWERNQVGRAKRRKWIRRAVKIALIIGLLIVLHPTIEISDAEAGSDPGSSPACVAMLTASRFSYAPSAANPIPCGLAEDQAGDVFEVAHGRKPDARGALTYGAARAWLLSHGWTESATRSADQCTVGGIVNAATAYARSRGFAPVGEVKAALDGYYGFVAGMPLSADWIGAYGSICGIGR